MKLELFEGNYAVCDLDTEISSPIFIDTKDFYHITNIENHLSLICLDKNIPENITTDKEWKIIKILEPINFYLVGILNKIQKILNDAKINIFNISTFDSDYILIKNKDIEYALKALIYNGYEIV